MGSKRPCVLISRATIAREDNHGRFRLRPDGDFDPPLSMTRRMALGAMGVGFALSMRPVDAATIITDTKGIVAGDVKIKVADGESPGYYARPEGKGPFPGVLIVSEIFGLHEHIRDLCRRMAKIGYAAVAPDYFYRAGDPATETDFRQDRARSSRPGEISADHERQPGRGRFPQSAAARSTNRSIAIMGFCWGGSTVWTMAATSPDIKAGAASYGPLAPRQGPPGAPPPEKRPWPIDLAPDLKAPVIGFYAGLDQEHLRRKRRRNARSAEEGQGEKRDHRLPDAQARLQRGLSAELQRERRQGCLGENAPMVQGQRRFLTNDRSIGPQQDDIV